MGKMTWETYTYLGYTYSVEISNKQVGIVRVNVTLRRVHGTTVTVDKQYVLHILSVYL